MIYHYIRDRSSFLVFHTTLQMGESLCGKMAPLLVTPLIRVRSSVLIPLRHSMLCHYHHHDVTSDFDSTCQCHIYQNNMSFFMLVNLQHTTKLFLRKHINNIFFLTAPCDCLRLYMHCFVLYINLYPSS